MAYCNPDKGEQADKSDAISQKVWLCTKVFNNNKTSLSIMAYVVPFKPSVNLAGTYVGVK